MPSHAHRMGYRTTFYRELPDSSGHCWNVPIWSINIADTDSHEEALEKALREFEHKFGCRKWSDTATLVEIEEALSSNAAADNPPKTKRIIWAES